MRDEDAREVERLARALIADLAKEPQPSAEELARHEHMKAEVLGHVLGKDLAPEPRRVRPLAVFSVGGKILDWVEGLVSALAPPDGAEPALVGERGIGRAAPPARQKPARIARSVGGVRLELAFLTDGDAAELELDLVSEADGTQARPFSVTVEDGQGRVLAGPLDVGAQGFAPRFPGPRPGVYVFRVSWAGGSAELAVEVRDV